MSVTIDQSFVKQFEREVHEAYQRQGSLLRGTLRTKNNVRGTSTTFQKIGKGVATTTGVIAALEPLVFLIALGAFGAVLGLTRRVFFGSLALGLALVVSAAGPPESPVADAAMRGDMDEVRTLLRSGADVNAAQGDGMTALHWAAEAGNAELAEVLVFAGANLEAQTRLGGFTPLLVASRAGNEHLVETLLGAGADVAVRHRRKSHRQCRRHPYPGADPVGRQRLCGASRCAATLFRPPGQ